MKIIVCTFVLILFGVAAKSQISDFLRESVQPISAAENQNEVRPYTHLTPDRIESVISSPVNFISQGFDVLNYDVRLNLSDAPALTTSNSRCIITFVWTSQPDTFRFHLRLLTVDSLYFIEKSGTSETHINGTFHKNEATSSATFHYAVSALPGHLVGDTVRLCVVYSGTMGAEPTVGGLSWGGVAKDGTDAVYALGVGFNCNYVSTTQHWMPCYDLPSDKATLSAEFICSPLYTVVSNGTLVFTSPFGANLALYRWRMESPCATYLMTFACGPYTRFDLGKTRENKPAELYAKKADTTAAKIICKMVPQMLQTFEAHYGNFPFEKVGYVVTENGSMEHQTMICLGRGELTGRDSTNEHVAHELAHQWFGDCVTPYDFRDAWLTESFATFSEALWMESIGGQKKYLADLKNKVTNYLTSIGKPGGRLFEGILPLYDFPRQSPSSNYPRTIYEKGAGVLGMLRYLVGDTIFFRSLNDYLSTNRYANATYDSLVNAFCRNVPGAQRDTVGSYFQQWVKGKGWAVLNIETYKQRIGNQWQSRMMISQTQPDSFGVYTWLPLECSFRDTQGNLVHRVVTLRAKDNTFLVDSVNDYNAVLINSGVNVQSLVVLTKTPTVSVAQELDESSLSLSIYPNPSSSSLLLQVPVEGVWALRIVNALGEIVAPEVTMNSSGRIISNDISSLGEGSYYLTVRNGSIVKSAPFLVYR